MQYMYRCELPATWTNAIQKAVRCNTCIDVSCQEDDDGDAQAIIGCNTCIDVSCQNTDVMKNQAVDGCNTCIRNKNQKLRKGELRI